MHTPRFSKEKLSIQAIGRLRFWLGLAAGIFTVFVLSVAINHTREVFRIFTTMNTDLLILPEADLQNFNLFFAALAATLGMSICLFFWLNQTQHTNRKLKRYKLFVTIFTLSISWFVLQLVIRYGMILSFILFNYGGMEFSLFSSAAFKFTLILLPIVVFLQSWFAVAMVYRIRKWFLISAATTVLIKLILVPTTSIDQEKINKVYLAKFEEDFKNVDEEINRAKAKYGIVFSEQTIEALKLWYVPVATMQVSKTTEAFARHKPVSMDTIILQKIIIKNAKPSLEANHFQKWPYATPQDILGQIYLSKYQPEKTRELFMVFEEAIKLVKTPDLEWDSISSYSENQKRRYFFKFNTMPESLDWQWRVVSDSLAKDAFFASYMEEFPIVYQMSDAYFQR